MVGEKKGKAKMLTWLLGPYRRWRYRQRMKEWHKGMAEIRRLSEKTPAQKAFKEGCLIVALRLAREEKGERDADKA